LRAVILSKAKNLGSCSFNQLRRSFLRFTQDRLRLLRMTGDTVFPRLASAWPAVSGTAKIDSNPACDAAYDPPGYAARNAACDSPNDFIRDAAHNSPPDAAWNASNRAI